MEIKAFKAYRFNEAVVGDVGSCIAPPYDVIDAGLQDRLYKKSKYNIAQITKSKAAPSDSPENNQYTRAGKLINEWFQTGALKRDDKDSCLRICPGFRNCGHKGAAAELYRAFQARRAWQKH